MNVVVAVGANFSVLFAAEIGTQRKYIVTV